MTPGAWIAVAAVVLALGVGLWRLGTDGRFRGTHAVRQPAQDGAVAPLAEGAPAQGRPLVEEGIPATKQPLVEEGAPAPVTRPPGADLVSAVAGTLGERATLLQFSSAFCAPCRATRRVLGEVVDLVDGVAHVEVDAEHHLDATRAFGILRTPTTVVLDAEGREVTRATGAPTRAQVLSALGAV
ncbi:putative thioredoxin [metagenome]|uniref:Putative thioredoxin n=1 Tax=metagenome TaxID=256318 RepID=A0A2P2C6N8_9ZZZZ